MCVVLSGLDDLFSIKENQKNFRDDIALFYNIKITETNFKTYETEDKNEGNMEWRICYKFTDIIWFDYQSQWVGLKTVFAVKRIITKGERTSNETNFYITDLDDTPKELLHIVR